MSSFYTTKSLGKEWLPSPVRGTRFASEGGRYGTWPPIDSPKLRSPSKYEEPRTWSSSASSWRRWSKFHERVILSIAMIVLLWSVHGHLQQRIENFKYNLHVLFDTSSSQSTEAVAVDPAWSQYAYSFYAYDAASLCSALTHIQALHRLNAKATRLLSYPESWTSSSNTAPLQDDIARLLKRAEREYKATLHPVPTSLGPQALSLEYGKLLIFNQTQHTRVVYIDTTASTTLKPLDEMFHFSEADVAMPRAYWTGGNQLSDLLILVKPDTITFERLVARFFDDSQTSDMQEEGQELSFMATLNKLFDEATFLPHRNFLLRASEFSKSQGDHAGYLGTYEEVWEAGQVIEDAKLVVFDDAQQQRPDCAESSGQARTLGGVATCAEREIWQWLVRDWKDRRMAVCGPQIARLTGAEQMSPAMISEEGDDLKHAEMQRKINADQEETARLLSQDMPEVQSG